MRSAVTIRTEHLYRPHNDKYIWQSSILHNWLDHSSLLALTGGLCWIISPRLTMSCEKHQSYHLLPCRDNWPLLKPKARNRRALDVACKRVGDKTLAALNLKGLKMSLNNAACCATLVVGALPRPFWHKSSIYTSSSYQGPVLQTQALASNDQPGSHWKYTEAMKLCCSSQCRSWAQATHGGRTMTGFFLCSWCNLDAHVFETNFVPWHLQI